MCQKSIANHECRKCKHIIGKTESNHRCSDVKSKKTEFGSCGNVEEKVATKRDVPCSTCKHEDRGESEPTAGPSQPRGRHDSRRDASEIEDKERKARHDLKRALERERELKREVKRLEKEKGKGKERENNPIVKPLASLFAFVSHSNKPNQETEVAAYPQSKSQQGSGSTSTPEPEQDAGVPTQSQPEPESRVSAQLEPQQESQVSTQPESHAEASFTAIQDWAFPSAKKTVADDLKEAQAHNIA